MELVVCEAGMVCMAGSWSTVWRCVHGDHGWILLWRGKGMDTNWGNLVVQPFYVLMCTHGVGSDSQMPAERCQVRSEICDWGRMCACSIHAPLNHCQTTLTHISSQQPERNLH